ncbi:MAG: NAD(P)/FAD-dependent oxidoreductase [Oscillospiraceae bacterium]
MIRLRNITLTPDEPFERLREKAEKELHCAVSGLTIARRSVDARKKNDVRFVYTVDVTVKDERGALARCKDAAPVVPYHYDLPVPHHIPEKRPVIVGFGPAGMFAGLVLALAGMRPIILERGEDAETRTKKVARMREAGLLDPESNIQFGEGGAGAFSDGKLTTGVKNPRIPWVLEQLVEAGAPVDIKYEAKPHIGTDLLPGICAEIRKKITALGGEVWFSQKLVGLESDAGQITAAVTETGRIPCSRLILACGHSARDTFEILCKLSIPMSPKAFAMGARIEHWQADTDRAQYGAFAGHPNLPPSDYSLACTLPNGRRCYTFCMCPGGEVVPAASEDGRVCVNGASPHDRNYVNSNAALLAAVSPADFPYDGILGGMKWQRDLERRAFEAGGGGYRAPAQTAGALLGTPHAMDKVVPSYEPGVTETDLHNILPPVILNTLAEALPIFGRRLRGFDAPWAVLTGPETRSSSPVRIERDESLQSPALRGLYPCGEGAGWAGGIMSAALDGMKCAEAVIASIE